MSIITEIFLAIKNDKIEHPMDSYSEKQSGF